MHYFFVVAASHRIAVSLDRIIKIRNIFLCHELRCTALTHFVHRPICSLIYLCPEWSLIFDYACIYALKMKIPMKLRNDSSKLNFPMPDSVHKRHKNWNEKQLMKTKWKLDEQIQQKMKKRMKLKNLKSERVRERAEKNVSIECAKLTRKWKQL